MKKSIFIIFTAISLTFAGSLAFFITKAHAGTINGTEVEIVCADWDTATDAARLLTSAIYYLKLKKNKIITNVSIPAISIVPDGHKKLVTICATVTLN